MVKNIPCLNLIKCPCCGAYCSEQTHKLREWHYETGKPGRLMVTIQCKTTGSIRVVDDSTDEGDYIRTTKDGHWAFTAPVLASEEKESREIPGALAYIDHYNLSFYPMYSVLFKDGHIEHGYVPEQSDCNYNVTREVHRIAVEELRKFAAERGYVFEKNGRKKK